MRLQTAYEQLRSAGDDYWATQVHVQINEALAWAAHAEGKNDEAVKLMRDVADEEMLSKSAPLHLGRSCQPANSLVISC